MTLRRKIVSLTLCLLLLFMATAAASLLLQSEISEQFSGVVDDYLPLNAAVATIDVFTDRYELDLRRLAADLRDAGTDAAAIAQQGDQNLGAHRRLLSAMRAMARRCSEDAPARAATLIPISAAPKKTAARSDDSIRVPKRASRSS